MMRSRIHNYGLTGHCNTTYDKLLIFAVINHILQHKKIEKINYKLNTDKHK